MAKRADRRNRRGRNRRRRPQFAARAARHAASPFARNRRACRDGKLGLREKIAEASTGFRRRQIESVRTGRFRGFPQSARERGGRARRQACRNHARLRRQRPGVDRLRPLRPEYRQDRAPPRRRRQRQRQPDRHSRARRRPANNARRVLEMLYARAKLGQAAEPRRRRGRDRGESRCRAACSRARSTTPAIALRPDQDAPKRGVGARPQRRAGSLSVAR